MSALAEELMLRTAWLLVATGVVLELARAVPSFS